MKRTLLEVLCGLAVLVLLVSFHHQIARLEIQSRSVVELERKVEQVASRASSKEEVSSLQQEILKLLEERTARLETRLRKAARDSVEAEELRRQIQETRRETDRLEHEITASVARTKDLVDAYMDEVRAKDQYAQATLQQTRSKLDALSGRVRPDPGELTDTMLLPTVQLNGDDTVGSGTLVFSGANPATGKTENYVITSYHVVRNILADTPRARQEGFDVTIYLPGDRHDVKGDMISRNERIDAALVRLRTGRTYPHVADVLAREEVDRVQVWEQVCAVGCPLGNDPVPSHGEISSTSNELAGTSYWMINAPTYFGNSGGGVYLSADRKLIGVFSKIYTHGKGTPVVVPHMGLCTPITSIYEWLDGERLTWVLEAPTDLPDIDPTRLAAPGK